MLNLRRIGWLSMPQRAAFAIVFLVFSSVQPAMFAGSPSDSMAMAMAAALPAAQAPDSHDHAATHGHAATLDHGTAHNEDGAGQQKHNPTSKSCEVHCAPAHAMPVAYCDIAPNFASCFEPIAVESLKASEYAEHIRPPRRLI